MSKVQNLKIMQILAPVPFLCGTGFPDQCRAGRSIGWFTRFRRGR